MFYIISAKNLQNEIGNIISKYGEKCIVILEDDTIRVYANESIHSYIETITIKRF